MKHTEIIYIASPYTSRRESEAERGAEQHARFTIVTRYAAALMREGWPVFSPITHGHPIWLASSCELDPTVDGWALINDEMMRAAWFVHVVTIKGWDQSRGVRLEREWFRKRGVIEQLVDLPHEYFDSELLLTYCR